ncbi:MAG TPA: matrixin family metalloprotease [Longimicrobiales bacterium]|nr:matrixin family metalloprotease [Longimicrobiales bacterium]
MRTLLRILVAVALLVGFLGILSARKGRSEARADTCAQAGRAEDCAPPDGDGCGTPAAPDCEVAAVGTGEARREGAAAPLEAATTRLPAAQVCPDAGYLCAGLAERGTWRVLRWNEHTRLIRVRVPLPPGDPARARDFQNAAARGIREWNGHPFPVRVDVSERPGPYDFVVRWATVLGGTELGHARTRWQRTRVEANLEVEDFSLATRSPFDPTRPLSPRQVELTAAHEMGHALGLPHSDRETDVMYPSNTATRLSARDFETMEALYELENGAEIMRR